MRESAFEMKQEVRIKQNNLVGKIIGIWEDVLGMSYKVRYQDNNGALQELWLTVNDMERIA